jgi:hypothetical protein
MPENNKDNCPNCESCGLKKLHTDIKDSIIILRKIDMRTEEHTDMIEVVNGKLNHVEVLATDTALEISKNMKSAAEINKELIQIVAGKKQVPISIFIMVLAVFTAVQFISLSVLFGLHLKFGSPILGGEIVKKIEAHDTTSK